MILKTGIQLLLMDKSDSVMYTTNGYGNICLERNYT